MDEPTVTLGDLPTIPNPTSDSNGSGPDQPHNHSWQPTSLIELAANPPEPPVIGGLLYPGKRTVLSGETESMKTWLALILCKAELDIGLTVGWADLDAMGPGAMLERLRLLGVDDQTIDDRFLYIEPSETLDPGRIVELALLIQSRAIRLFIIDAFNPILSLHSLDPNATPDIETFWRTIADPISRAGAAPVLLDHVVKNAENRGKYSYGSERKASGSIVHIGFKLLEPLTKGGRGRTLLSVHKDRPGYLPRPVLGKLVLASDGDHVSYVLEPDHSHDDSGGFRPTALMEKISRALEMVTEPATTNWIQDNVQGKGDAKRTAIVKLIDDGYLRAEKGERKAVLHTLVRPYREADDVSTSSASPVRPDYVPNLTSSECVPASPPRRGRGRSASASPDAVPLRPAEYDDLTHDAPMLALELLTDTEPETYDDQPWGNT